MNTKFTSYIQYQDFETLITSCFSSEKASIIDKSLHDNFIIVPRGKKFMAYQYHHDNTSSCLYNVKLYLMPAITYLLETSFERLTDDQQSTIKQRFSTKYRDIFNHKAVNEYYKSVVIMLLRHDYKHDISLGNKLTH